VRAVQALPQSLVELVRGQSASTDEHGLGWGLAPGSGASPSAIAHSGATGSILVVDPAQDLVIVYLRNWWDASMDATTQAVEAVYAAVS
jgi:CubicO group peptidase (beta-lactamase class C family)